MQVGADPAPKRVFRLLQAVLKLRHAHLRCSELLLGLVDIEGRDGAQFQLSSGSFQKRPRQLEVVFAYTQRFPLVDDVPIGVLSLHQQVDDARADLLLGQF